MATTTIALAISLLLPLQVLGDDDDELTAGKLLVASRDLKDPNFTRTVVLLIEHNDEGAVGLVINRPTEVKLSEVLPDMKPLKRHGGTVYSGGPVARDALMMLIRSASRPEESERVIGEIHVSGSRKLLGRMARRKKGDDSFRVYAGYAGWAAGQLEFEVAIGGWHIEPADEEIVFSDKPIGIWQRLVPAEPALRASASPPASATALD